MSTIHRDSTETEWHGPFIMARACTTIALPAYTYNNGTAGVGATITLNANAALPAFDGVTVAVNDVVKVLNGASFADNGDFVVTALGDGSTTPGVLTRDPRCDTQNKILAVAVKIREGISRRGAMYEYSGASSITMGTTALSWIRVDQNRGPNEYSVCETDFDQQTVTVATSTTMAGPFAGFSTISGTASVAPKLVAAQTERGVFTFSATTATASAILSFAATPKPFWLDQVQGFRLSGRIAGPNALSDGTDTYRVIFGIASSLAAAATDGIWVEYTQATSTRWLGVARASSVSTTTGSSGPTVTTTTYMRYEIIHFPGESGLWVSFDGGALIALASNVPFGVALTVFMMLAKSAGTNARTLDTDSYKFEQWWPNGRAA